jgi:hypothetical protein
VRTYAFVFGVFVVAGLTGCDPKVPPTKKTQKADKKEPIKSDLRLFVTTEMRGELEPCGCTREPLGGLPRLHGAIKTQRHGARQTALLTHGDLRVEHAPRPAARDQAIRSAQFLTQSLISAGLVAAGDGAQDAALDPALKTSMDAPGFPALPTGGVRTVDRLTVLRGWPLTRTPPKNSALTVLLSPFDLAEATQAAEALRSAGVHLVVLQRGSEKSVVKDLGGGLFALHAGQRGQHLLQVDLFLDDRSGPLTRLRGAADRAQEEAGTEERLKIIVAARDRMVVRQAPERAIAARTAQIERLKSERAHLSQQPLPEVPATGRLLVVRQVTLDSQITADPATSDALAQFHRRNNDANRAAEAQRSCPPAPASGVAQYVGSDACKGCHQEAYDFWLKTPHSKAWKTLEVAGRDYDYRCVGCHSVGFDQPEGFCRVAEAGSRVNVNCEACHGPGSAHLGCGGPDGIERQVTPATCAKCHHPPHTNTFDFAERLARIVGPGHGQKVKK